MHACMLGMKVPRACAVGALLCAHRYDDGNVDVHLFAPAFTAPAKGELQVLYDVLGASPKQAQAAQQGAANGQAEGARARRA